MVSKRKDCIVFWDHDGPDVESIQVIPIAIFDARGKRRVYGRGDHFGRLIFNMDIWQSTDGHLFVRFWSNSSEVDWISYEIIGHTNKHCEECWVPEKIRNAYEDWILSEI